MSPIVTLGYCNNMEQYDSQGPYEQSDPFLFRLGIVRRSIESGAHKLLRGMLSVRNYPYASKRTQWPRSKRNSHICHETCQMTHQTSMNYLKAKSSQHMFQSLVITYTRHVEI
jgi:hypothetical protein